MLRDPVLTACKGTKTCVTLTRTDSPELIVCVTYEITVHHWKLSYIFHAILGHSGPVIVGAVRHCAELRPAVIPESHLDCK